MDKILTAKELLKNTLIPIELNIKVASGSCDHPDLKVEDKKFTIHDIYYSELIESGKYLKNVAYELRIGKDPIVIGQPERNTIFKVNVVKMVNGEFFSEEGYKTLSKDGALNWISKRRDWYIKKANAELLKEQGIKNRRGPYKKK